MDDWTAQPWAHPDHNDVIVVGHRHAFHACLEGTTFRGRDAETLAGEKFWLLPRGFRLFARRNNIPVPAYPTADDKPNRSNDSQRGFQ